MKCSIFADPTTRQCSQYPNSDILLSTELLTYVQGPKGVPQLIIRNFLYIKHCGELTKTSYWKCRLYDRGQCKARCRTGVNEVVLTGVHTHLPDMEKLRNRIVVKQTRVNLLAHINNAPTSRVTM